MNDVDTDVLVVGSGPSGATAALALATYGVSVLAINKHRSTAISPRAHVTNQRALEVLRDLGVEQRALKESMPHEWMRNNIFCTSLAGQELGRMEAWSTHPLQKMQHDLASPCSVAELTQESLEPILTSEAAVRGAHMRLSTELVSLEQDDDGVSSSLRDRVTGLTYTVRSKYVIGADGASSRVAEMIGLPMAGKTNLGASIGIGFKADLTRFFEHRPGDMFWMVQPGHGILGYSIGSLRVVHAWDRWIGSWGYDPDGPEPELTKDDALAIVRRLIGDDSVEIELETFSTWKMHQVHAERVSQGRIFCVGDAVHRHPPANGLGSNTSIQDSFNLAWKLAYTLSGRAGTGLLDTYDQERAPVAEHLVNKTMGSMRYFAPIAEAIGLQRDHQTQADVDALVADLFTTSEESARKRAALREAVAGNVYLHAAIGGEHNLLYTSDAVIADNNSLHVDDPELEVIRGLESGRRLPHVWLTRNQLRVSSLDVCGKGRFVLLTGPSGIGWKEVADQVSRRLDLPLEVQAIGLGCEFDDIYGDFARLCLPDETGAILVRPDHVVAWHVETWPQDPAGLLTSVLDAVLDRAHAPLLPVEPELEQAPDTTEHLVDGALTSSGLL